MPKANDGNTLSNCVKLTVGDNFIGYFRNDVIARIAAKAIIEIQNPNWSPEIVIEPWFIGGEF